MGIQHGKFLIINLLIDTIKNGNDCNKDISITHYHFSTLFINTAHGKFRNFKFSIDHIDFCFKGRNSEFHVVNRCGAQ